MRDFVSAPLIVEFRAQVIAQKVDKNWPLDESSEQEQSSNLGLPITATGRLLPLRCQTNDGARLTFVGIRQRACFSKMHRVRAEHGASDAGGTQIKIGGVGVRWGPKLGEFEVPPPA